MGLSVELVRQPDGRLQVVLGGRIDENAAVQSVLAKVTEDATFDLSQVQSINSIGLMKWVVAFTALSEAHRLEVEAVPYCLAIQANQVSDLFGRARLMSCRAPYFCSTCKANREVVVRVTELAASGGAPDKPCTSCGAVMDFDETDGFFAFLTPAS